MKLRTVIGIILASPITLFTVLFYVLPFTMLGWYQYRGWYGKHNDKSPLGYAPVWMVRLERCPEWLVNYWSKWGGHCIGTAVVVKKDPDLPNNLTLIHELHHVDQMHRLGFLQPIMYALSSLCAKISGEDSYLSNAFEISARRVAGQIVDRHSFMNGYNSCKQERETKND